MCMSMFSTVSSGGYSYNARRFIVSHRGGGFQPLMQQGPNPSQAQRPRSMSPVHMGAPPMNQNSFGATSSTPRMPSAAGPGTRQQRAELSQNLRDSMKEGNWGR